ncbi:MAG TPA: hypothetical protein VI357_16265 [Mycobacteriales bacterium]
MNETLARRDARLGSRRIRAAAYAVPLCVLPSALWRLHAVFVKGVPAGCERLMRPWEPYYVASLSAVSFLAALLTVGLVRPWGEVVPAWVPVLGGRKIPVLAAVLPAAVGAVLIFAVYGYAVLNALLGFREPPDIPGCPDPSHEPYAWVAIACYASLLAWGPLLVLVTVAYYRRRRG